MVESERVPGDALEDIAYLSRSKNRVVVLKTLASTTRTLPELRDQTETSRSTLSRILNEFEDRNWAHRTPDGAYTATTQGHHVVVQFTPFLNSMDTIRELGEAMDVFPPSELTEGETVTDLGAFDDVTVYRTTSTEPDKLYSVWLDRIQQSDTLRILADVGLTKAGNAAVHDEVVSDRLETTAVCSPSVVETFLDPDRGYSTPDDILERHEAGGRLYRYQGDIPCNLSIFDETLILSDRDIETAIETDNERIRAWADTVFERYLEDAALVTPSDIADPDP